MTEYSPDSANKAEEADEAASDAAESAEAAPADVTPAASAAGDEPHGSAEPSVAAEAEETESDVAEEPAEDDASAGLTAEAAEEPAPSGIWDAAAPDSGPPDAPAEEEQEDHSVWGAAPQEPPAAESGGVWNAASGSIESGGDAAPGEHDSGEPGEEAEAAPVEVLRPPSHPDYKWYILQTYSGFEHRVEKTVNEKLRVEKLEELVEEIFVPGEDVERVKNGKKRKTHVIYYPGYVLIKMKLTDDLWHLLMDIPRVSGFVGGTKREPRPLAEDELGVIRSQMNQGLKQTALRDEFEVGQQVIVTDGPFANFGGKIDEVNHEKTKLRVLISILGRNTPVELDFDKVKAHPDAG